MANFNFNKVIIGGRLTADPDLKTTPSGISVCSFVVAVNRRASGDREAAADFLNCTAWRQTAEFISRYFHKASSICVMGSIQTRSWVDQQGQKRFSTEIVADEAFFVDAKSEMPEFRTKPPAEQVAKPQPQAYSTPGARAEIAGEMAEGDGELPF